MQLRKVIKGRTGRENLLLWLSSLLFAARHNSLPSVFLKPDDLISRSALAGKDHDEEVIEALRLLCSKISRKYVDIGANIGLMAVAVGQCSENIVCIEPNPLIANILRTNLALRCKNFTVHEFALGAEEGNLELYVPKFNMGGAFIRDSNSYDDGLLAKKDGFGSIDEVNYLKYIVPVKSYSAALALIFGSELDLAGVVVKFDVEGFELQVLQALLDRYPASFQKSDVAVLFECHESEQIENLREKVQALNCDLFLLTVEGRATGAHLIPGRISKLLFGTNRSLTFDSSPGAKAPSGNYLVCSPSIVNALQ